MLRSMSLLAVALFLGCNQQADTQQADTQENYTGAYSSQPSDSSSSTKVLATCEIIPIGDSGVSGTIEFVGEGNQVSITGEISGLTPGEHGFHVHENGDLSDKAAGKSAGGHFNPTDDPHGRPNDQERHIGDLGNIVANEEGVATIDITDSMIRLDGEQSIVGRALVIHADADQFTQPSGDAGDRVAFGKIEVSSK